jgi:hypothetical protein
LIGDCQKEEDISPEKENTESVNVRKAGKHREPQDGPEKQGYFSRGDVSIVYEHRSKKYPFPSLIAFELHYSPLG